MVAHEYLRKLSPPLSEHPEWYVLDIVWFLFTACLCLHEQRVYELERIQEILDSPDVRLICSGNLGMAVLNIVEDADVFILDIGRLHCKSPISRTPVRLSPEFWEEYFVHNPVGIGKLTTCFFLALF